MKFKYVGDAESPVKTTVLGVPFVKGEATEVDEKLVVSGKKLTDILAGMSHFEAVEEDRAAEKPAAKVVPPAAPVEGKKAAEKPAAKKPAEE